MKKCIQSEKGEILLDTDRDVWLYLAPRGGNAGRAFGRGSDLYLHEEEGLPDIYYIHTWSTTTSIPGRWCPAKTNRSSPSPSSPPKEFLESRGLVLAAYPKQRGTAVIRLRHRGKVLNMPAGHYLIADLSGSCGRSWRPNGMRWCIPSESPPPSFSGGGPRSVLIRLPSRYSILSKGSAGIGCSFGYACETSIRILVSSPLFAERE